MSIMPHDDFALCLPITPLDVEHLTKPSTVERLPADERTAEAPEAVEPGERALDDGSDIARFDAMPGNAWNDATGPQRLPTLQVVVALVSAQQMWQQSHQPERN